MGQAVTSTTYFNVTYSTQGEVKWTDLGQKTLDDIKFFVSQDTLLAYTDINRRFDIHMDARNYHLGAVIIYNGKPIAFCSSKFTGPQTWYTVTEN